jgi:hypothetical protein
MSALTDLIETAVIADLNLDSTLAGYTPQPHDSRATDDAPVFLSVTATEKGELKAGTGIERVLVEVVARVNEKAEGVAEGTLGLLERKICDRLPVQIRTPAFQESGGGLAPANERLSTASVKVFGLESASATPRLDAGLTRTRVIARTLIAAQLS